MDLRAFAAQLASSSPMGGRRTSDSALYCKKHDGPLPPLPFPIQSNDTTGEAIEKLKHFINVSNLLIYLIIELFIYTLVIKRKDRPKSMECGRGYA